MAVALDLARLGEGRTSPNPTVGALVVKDGTIVGRGFHRGPGQPHAEIEAIRDACRGESRIRPKRVGRPLTTGLLSLTQGSRRNRVALYVTLEPCCPPKKGGRTPPCTDAIIKSGIQDIVIGMKDPDPRVSGRGIAILRKAGLRVRVGILEKECRRLNEAYVTHRTKKRPFVTLKMAITSDGKVGLRGEGDHKVRPYKITGPEADAYVHALRDRVDAILVGTGTVLTDDPRLTTRLRELKGRDPIRVVLNGRRRIPPEARILRLKSATPTWIATSLTRKRTSKGRVDLSDLLRALALRGVLHLLVEGGPTVWSAFLEKRLVDRLIRFVAPKRLGPRGLPALPPSSRASKILGSKARSARRIGRDLLLETDL
ncbi:MAG TPA: bifunctional diaminohydroxyphosphoribosylaminopyrimidine deaminase/5-amino-6-(5-phosphoribosylamino)uracil reductase RibD [bacterium]|nr:bifunctional diaminohydroxyphosphoribosylaminopyrimidine deaminase/5-amino-6-(5-phosphoribosylamino)uracil reductase RibD [bacterium]